MEFLLRCENKSDVEIDEIKLVNNEEIKFVRRTLGTSDVYSRTKPVCTVHVSNNTVALTCNEYGATTSKIQVKNFAKIKIYLTAYNQC